MIYLDNAGTTKMFEECVQVHKCFSCEQFYNPSALSAKSAEVFREISDAEKFFLDRLGAKEGDILFTSGATESNNLAIFGSLRTGDWEYVFSQGEHPSVYEAALRLQQEGRTVHFVPLGKNGALDLVALKSVLSPKTRLISTIFVSNETGAINDIMAISALKKQLCPKAILHVDGVQGFCKIPLDLSKTAVDLFSFSAHKINGPKGVAALYVKNKGALKSLLVGGGQQFGLRSGTENVSGIMQFKKAVELTDVQKNFERVCNLRQIFCENLTSQGVKINNFAQNGEILGQDEQNEKNGVNKEREENKEGEESGENKQTKQDLFGFSSGNSKFSPYILNLIFDGVKAETMLHALEEKGVIIGLGSACSAKKAGNRVLSQIGVPKNKIISSARISFSPYMSEDEVVAAAKIICEVYEDIRRRVGV